MVARASLSHRLDRQLGVRRLPGSERPGQPVPGDRHEVSQDGTRGGRAPGTPAVEHQLAGRIRLDEYSVERVVDSGKRMRARDHGGMHADSYRVAVHSGRPLADREQLHRAAHRLGAGHVGGRDVRDPLAVHIGCSDAGVEREPGQDGGLRRRVEPVDVGTRVRFGIPQGAGLVQRLGEAGAGLVHPGQDVVGGSVHDPDHTVQPVTGEGLAQRAQQWDRPGHRRLVVQVDRGLAGGGMQRRAVLGEQGLVRRDHRLTALECGQDQAAGRLDAADDLHDDVHIGARDEFHSVGCNHLR